MKCHFGWNCHKKNAINDCFHDATKHTHDVMYDDINLNITETNSHLINTKEAMNKAYQDIKNPIMLKIAKQIEELIKNSHMNKNTLITTSIFNVINSKLDKIIKKMENPEIQFIETPMATNTHKIKKEKPHGRKKRLLPQMETFQLVWIIKWLIILKTRKPLFLFKHNEKKKIYSDFHKFSWNIKSCINAEINK